MHNHGPASGAGALWSVALACGVALGALAGVSAARAEGGEEHLIGTFTIRPPAGAEAAQGGGASASGASLAGTGASATTAGSSTFGPGTFGPGTLGPGRLGPGRLGPGALGPASPSAEPTVSATEQLGAALALFASGDRSGGQRQLEHLVARWPASGEATQARKVLAELYRQPATSVVTAAPRTETPAPATVAAVPAGPAPQSAPQANAAAVTPPSVPPARGGVDGWVVKVQRDAGLERRFIMEVGDRVFFGLASAELGSRARAVLAAQARWLEANPTLSAVIEGHADEPGSDEDNRALAQTRAEAVRARLLEEGVAPDRLKAVGLGRSQRLAQCDEPECAAQNRRVVTAILAGEGGRRPPPLGALPTRPESGAVRAFGPAAHAIVPVASR